MSAAGAIAAASVGRLRTGVRRPFSEYGRGLIIRCHSSGMTLDNINRAAVDRIIRVDHAGEYGANRIYAGQMAVLGRTSVGPVIQKMWDQEKNHLKKFNELMIAFRVRPTVLMPLWNMAGFALGAGTALLGKEGAMACTVAVEESIANHYNNQIRMLMEEDPEKYEELLQVIKQFRDEELEHHDTGLDHDAELPFHCLNSWKHIPSYMSSPGRDNDYEKKSHQNTKWRTWETAMCRVMREAWVQIPALPLQAIGSQAVNIACLGLSVPTCKVEMKTEAALKIVLHGRDEQVPHREGLRTATEGLFWLASISLHNAANRQGRGVLYLTCSLCKLCAQWL
uniref:5-demethoxyubiquinone hydroxylase, mitochondrial n=1 Tax=Mus spicilegus TaxID=10103 RepID=A0A8C6GED6_MUSSI